MCIYIAVLTHMRLFRKLRHNARIYSGRKVGKFEIAINFR